MLRRTGRRPAVTIDAALIERLRELSTATTFQSDIALELGISHSAVGKHQRRLNLPRPTRSHSRARIDG
jgi:hypothetical protein